jgi:hypothetical protein
MTDKFKTKYGINPTGEDGACITALTLKDYDMQITSSPHIVTVSFHLPRVRLYITKVKGVNRCIYEFSSGKTLFAAHRFSESVFEKDVLLVGYLFPDLSLFIAEDIIVNRGEPTTSLAIDKRITLVNELIDHHYVPDPILETNNIVAKEYVEYEFLQSFYTEHALKQSYAPYINGLIFCPLGPGANIKLTAQTEVAIKKPTYAKAHADPYAERHLIVNDPAVSKCVFTVKKTQKPDVYELYLLDKDGVIRYYDIACVPTKVESKKIKKMLSVSNLSAVECLFNREFGRWMPYERSNKKVNTITHLYHAQQ